MDELIDSGSRIGDGEPVVDDRARNGERHAVLHHLVGVTVRQCPRREIGREARKSDGPVVRERLVRAGVRDSSVFDDPLGAVTTHVGCAGSSALDRTDESVVGDGRYVPLVTDREHSLKSGR